MPPLLNSYDKYLQVFKDNNCELLTTFEELKELRKSHSKIGLVKVDYMYKLCEHINNICLVSFVERGYGHECDKCLSEIQTIKKYNSYKKNFEENECILLTTIDEFKEKQKRTIH
jgi:hypothetical protein